MYLFDTIVSNKHTCMCVFFDTISFDFDHIKEYLRNKTYPSTIPARNYGFKLNFRRATKLYEVKDSHLIL